MFIRLLYLIILKVENRLWYYHLEENGKIRNYLIWQKT